MRLPRLSWHRRFTVVFAAAGLLSFAAVTACLVVPAASPLRSRNLSTLVLARDGSILRGFLSTDGKWRFAASATDVDPIYLRMLIAAEDRHFALHPGIDPAAVLRAVGQLIWRGHVVSGASTLTMQAVRLLERRPRTLATKLTEAVQAVKLQRQIGRRGVLDLYLTLAPFGGNLEGVRAASLAYFGKEPGHLSPGEAALLVALPRSPEQLRPDRHVEAARRARDAVLERMHAAGIISNIELAEARAEQVPQRRQALPFHAPHLARSLRLASPATPLLRTMVDAGMQRRIEALLHREVAALDPQATIAALVVDNRTHAVVAAVGNAEFSSDARRGTLDMTRAVRSPGSALKPLIYAMAFDRLLIHPQTLLDDRPRHFGVYAPSDFDGHFEGEVSAAEALQYSLNVPAVAVLERLGPSRFTGALAAAGIKLRLPSRTPEPGLAIALGGAGISLFDLTTLYGALSEGGKVVPLRVLADNPPGTGTAIFGPAAAWYVSDILGSAPPPPGMLPASVAGSRHLAFKTGTSYGFRDAWAIGYDRAATIAVWVGRPDGTPLPGISGRVTAAPIMFKIADLLSPAPAEAPMTPPPGVLQVARKELPMALQRLDPAASPIRQDRAPAIVYPPDGATIVWDGGTVPLEASGGVGSLRWLVDGRPLPLTPAYRHPSWQPAGIGFAHLAVVDSAGHSARATVRLTP